MKFWDFPDISEFPKILSLKSFGNSWGKSYIPCLLLTIMLRFTFGENKNLVKHQKVSKYEDHGCLQNFILLFMSWLKAPILKKSHNLIRI